MNFHSHHVLRSTPATSPLLTTHHCQNKYYFSQLSPDVSSFIPSLKKLFVSWKKISAHSKWCPDLSFPSRIHSEENFSKKKKSYFFYKDRHQYHQTNKASWIMKFRFSTLNNVQLEVDYSNKKSTDAENVNCTGEFF